MSTQMKAVGFYGDTFMQESNLTDYNLIVEKDDQLFAGSYEMENGALTIVYNQPVPEWSKDFVIWFDEPVTIDQPSVLVLYGDSFLDTIAEIPELEKHYSQLSNATELSFTYYKGFVTSYANFQRLHNFFVTFAEKKLQYLFRNLRTEDVNDYESCYELWRNLSSTSFSTVEGLAVIMYWEYLLTGKKEVEFYKVHADRINPDAYGLLVEKAEMFK